MHVDSVHNIYLEASIAGSVNSKWNIFNLDTKYSKCMGSDELLFVRPKYIPAASN